MFQEKPDTKGNKGSTDLLGKPHPAIPAICDMRRLQGFPKLNQQLESLCKCNHRGANKQEKVVAAAPLVWIQSQDVAARFTAGESVPGQLATV